VKMFAICLTLKIACKLLLTKYLTHLNLFGLLLGFEISLIALSKPVRTPCCATSGWQFSCCSAVKY
jgi:hypothetical protein